MGSKPEIDTGGAAFPYLVTPEFYAAEQGMTLRDYFAARELVAMGTWSPNDPDDNNHFGQNTSSERRMELRAGRAYAMADAMLYARTAHLKSDGSDA